MQQSTRCAYLFVAGPSSPGRGCPCATRGRPRGLRAIEESARRMPQPRRATAPICARSHLPCWQPHARSGECPKIDLFSHFDCILASLLPNPPSVIFHSKPSVWQASAILGSRDGASKASRRARLPGIAQSCLQPPSSEKGNSPVCQPRQTLLPCLPSYGLADRHQGPRLRSRRSAFHQRPADHAEFGGRVFVRNAPKASIRSRSDVVRGSPTLPPPPKGRRMETSQRH